MQIWMTLILAVQLLTAVIMIGLVLVQHGKGADMGAAFGGGSSGSMFGASGSANFLSRSTAILATIFFLTSIALTVFVGKGKESEGVMNKAADPAKSESPASQVPVPSSVPAPVIPVPSAPAKPAELPK